MVVLWGFGGEEGGIWGSHVWSGGRREDLGFGGGVHMGSGGSWGGHWTFRAEGGGGWVRFLTGSFSHQTTEQGGVRETAGTELCNGGGGFNLGGGP